MMDPQEAARVPSLPRPSRRCLPFGLVAACVPLLFAWGTTISVNCPLGDPAAYCHLFGVNRSFGYTALALPAGLGGVLLGWLVPDRWIDSLAGRFGLEWLFDPPDPTLLALVPLVLAAAVPAPFLFFGEVTHRIEVWLVLAVPYVPGLALLASYVGLSSAVGQTTGAVHVLLVAWIVLSFVLAAVAQAAWFYLLAGWLGRLGVGVVDRLGRPEGPRADQGR